MVEMIVYEFYLRDQFKEQAFEALCNSFYLLGGVYSVSRNFETDWIQLLISGGTSQAIYTAIEGKINGLSDAGGFSRYVAYNEGKAPPERPREAIGI